MSSSQNKNDLTQFFEGFAEKVGQKSKRPYFIVQEVARWVGDQPSLAKLLCELVLAYPSEIPDGQEKSIVSTLVYKNIVNDWINNKASAYLKDVVANILRDDRKDAILSLYLKVLQGNMIPESEGERQRKLVQSGLIKIDEGKLKAGNAIYQTIFGLEWVESHISVTDLPDSETVQMSVTQSSQSDNTTRSSTRVLSAIIVGLVLAVFIGALLFRKPDEKVRPKPQNTPTPSATSSSPPEIADLSDMELFRTGDKFAENGDWLEMVEHFCRISEDSSAFKLAERKLDHWINEVKTSYREDIELSFNVFSEDGSEQCIVVENALEQ